MQNYDTDVIVIGAGPAGLSACFWLQKLSIPHILIEKETFPRPKSCADNLTSNAIRYLNHIDPDIVPDMSSKGLLRPIKGVYFSCRVKDRIQMNFKWLDDVEHEYSCYGVEREKMDDYLLKKLLQNSLTTLYTDTQVTTVDINDDRCSIKVKDGSVYASKMVIVATGSNYNPMAGHKPAAFGDKHIAVGVRAYYKGINVENDYCHFYTKKNIMPGGFYIAPLEDGMYNVNMVIRKDVVKKNKLDLKKEFESYINTDPELKSIFQHSERVSEFQGSSLLLGTKEKPVCGNRYMIAGDSAGLIDLITANGIPQAMLSGKMAALQAEKCIKANDFSHAFIHNYEKELYKSVKSYLVIGRFMNPLFNYKFVNNFVVNALGLFSKTASKNSALVDLLYKKRPLLLLFNPLFYYRVLKKNNG